MKKFFSWYCFFLLLCILLGSGLLPAANATVYEVGPGKAFVNIGDVPWENLSPGDTVLIHYRVQPYHEKWVIDKAGTSTMPITVRGVPGPQGQLPIIDGSQATTRRQLDFWSEERGIINIGGSNKSSLPPTFIVIEALDIRNARPPYWFRDDHGQMKYYSKNATSIYIIEGDHITIRNCRLHGCGNGFFACHDAANILVEACHIYDNGIEGSYYQHNNYTEAKGIIFQFNYFGPLRQGCGGNNLKDRSAGTIIRYNWIEGGNRQIDLVDSSYRELIDMPSYQKTYVYGNIIVERSDDGNSQIIHYGGDSGNLSRYRKGTLYFYNNTVISKRNGNTTLLRLSSQAESCIAINNIIYVTAPGNHLALLNRDGTLMLRNNWLKTGWRQSHEGPNFRGHIDDDGGNLSGTWPGFLDMGQADYRLQADSPCIDSGIDLADIIPMGVEPSYQYVKYQNKAPRPQSGNMDMGAFEAEEQVTNQDPVIEYLRADHTTVENPKTVIRFSAGAIDPDGDQITYRLDFGDGTKTGSMPATHSYSHKGTYNVTLTVIDGKNGSASAGLTIIVNDKAPKRPENVKGEI